MGGGLRVQELYTGSCIPPFTLPEPTPNNSTQGAEAQALDYPSVVAAHCLIHYCYTGRQQFITPPTAISQCTGKQQFITPPMAIFQSVLNKQ